MQAETKRRDRQALARSRELRRDSTEAERKLWSLLRAKGLERLKFRRQVEIGGFFADFCCPKLKLIVEVDGGQHAEQIAYDEHRTRALAAKGYTVIRFWNGDVLDNIEGVGEAILAKIEEIRKSRPSP